MFFVKNSQKQLKKKQNKAKQIRDNGQVVARYDEMLVARDRDGTVSGHTTRTVLPMTPARKIKESYPLILVKVLKELIGSKYGTYCQKIGRKYDKYCQNLEANMINIAKT